MKLNRYAAPVVFLVAAIAVAARGQYIVEERTPGFCVAVDRDGWLTLKYEFLSVVTGLRLEVAKPDWQGKVFPVREAGQYAVSFGIERERDEGTRTLRLQSREQGPVNCSTSVELSTQQVCIETQYTVEPSPEAGYIYMECFFSRELLNAVSYETGDGRTGTIQAHDWPGISGEGVREVRLRTRFGLLTVRVTHEQTVADVPTAVPWQFRSVCDREWGPEERRTFSLMNLYPVTAPARIVGRTEYVFALEPSQDLADRLQELRAEQDRQRDALMAARQQRTAARRQRIAADGGIVLLPQPRQLTVGEGVFAVTAASAIVVGSDLTAAEMRPGKRLAEELEAYFGVTVPIRRANDVTSTGSAIVVGRPEINPLAGRLLAHKGLSVGPSDPGPEGFVLEVDRGGVVVSGSDVNGTWYGVQALLQMLRRDGSRVLIPAARIRDWPEFSTRAMMLTLGVREQLPFLRRTLRRVLPRARINMVFIGGASLGRVRWPSHPEVGYDNSFTPEDIRELAQLARDNFIEPVPHVQGFGHTGPLKSTHPELLAAGSTSRQPCLDITKPAARQFVLELYADAVEAFRPERYFHVGFDEAQGLELICGERRHADVVAEHINAVHAWLKQHNLRMIMWADMLLEYERFKDSSAANSGNPHYGGVDTAPALPLIPKDIIQANWYYREAQEHPALAYLRDGGFSVFPTTWFSPENNYNFTRSAAKLNLDWVSGSSWMYCAAQSPGMTSLLIGEYGWTPGVPALDELNYDPTELLATWLKSPRVSDGPCDQQPLDLSAAMNRSYVDEAPGDDRGWMDMGPERDLSALRPGVRQFGRYTFSIKAASSEAGCVLAAGTRATLAGVATDAVVELGTRCDALVFLHTANCHEYGPRQLGSYVVSYGDATEETVSLRNTINIGPWRRVRYDRHFGDERVSGYYVESERAWVGFTRAGEEVDLVACEWTNPRPDKPISTLKLAVTDGRPETAIALFAVTALKRR